MRRVKYIVILPLCLFMGSCPNNNPDLYVDIWIGDYEGHLEAWNNRNMLDYQLYLFYVNRYGSYSSKRAFVTVKNGIPESSDPPEWLASGEKSTVPEFFSFIKEEEKRVKEKNDRATRPGCFSASYDAKYHYPWGIYYVYRTTDSDRTPDWEWGMIMIPLVENEQEAWDKQNMPDYKLSLYYYHDGRFEQAVVNVKNGIPESSEPPEWLAGGKMSTVPEFFSFVKEEEKRLENVRTTSEGYFKVIYDPEYRYPRYITTTGYTGSILSGKDYRWNITLTPLGETE